MSKRYRETVEVESAEGSIEAFWWRGKRYAVSRVLSRWREAGGWWHAAGESAQPWTAQPWTAQPWTAGESREVIRVQAAHQRAIGTYELARDLRAGTWMLARVWD